MVWWRLMQRKTLANSRRSNKQQKCGFEQKKHFDVDMLTGTGRCFTNQKWCFTSRNISFHQSNWWSEWSHQGRVQHISGYRKVPSGAMMIKHWTLGVSYLQKNPWWDLDGCSECWKFIRIWNTTNVNPGLMNPWAV